MRHDRAYSPAGTPSRIFYTSISAYAKDLGLSGEAMEEMISVVVMLDEEFLSFVDESMKKDA